MFHPHICQLGPRFAGGEKLSTESFDGGTSEGVDGNPPWPCSRSAMLSEDGDSVTAAAVAFRHGSADPRSSAFVTKVW